MAAEATGERRTGPRARVFTEEWAPSFGSPYHVGPLEDEVEEVELAEDGELQPHRVEAAAEEDELSFVDGVRRTEAWLYREDPETGAAARGLAGAFAVGSVRVVPGERPAFGEHRIERLLIWGGGADDELPAVAGGWRWEVRSIQDPDPDAPLHELQRRMRAAEAELGEDIARRRVLTVLDGTLSLVRAADLPIVGYVKTHHRALLAPAAHALVPQLGAGERTSLFQLRRQGQRGRPYSCYFRLAERDTPMASPWSGIVRLEIPESGGLEAARGLARRAAAAVRRFAGVRHRDPRAPQNLQPVGALEERLRHLFGQPGLATRAVREAVARLHREAPAVAAGSIRASTLLPQATS